MIRPTNINVPGNLCDLRCDTHDAFRNNVNLIALANHYRDKEGGPVSGVWVDGSILTSGSETCDHVTFFPLNSNVPRNQQINAAKPAP